MLLGNLINDSFGRLSKQLKFYCWHYKRDLDQRQRQELIDILDEQYFERLANKIKSLTESDIADCRQQIAKLLFERCLAEHRRHQLIQLIESDLVDVDVRLDNYGRTLLHRTAYNLDVELVKLLIDHGVNIKLRDFAGNTALHIAIQSYRNGSIVYNNEPQVVKNLIKIIQLLLDADVNLQKLDSVTNKKIKLENNLCFDKSQSRSNQSKFNETNDETNLIKESQQKAKQSATDQVNLVTGRDQSDNRDVTICRILGSHCMCKINSNHQQLQSCNAPHDAPNLYQNDSLIKEKQNGVQSDTHIVSMYDEFSIPLIDTRNAFGRTALHYCVLVVGEQHIDQIVELLLSYGANPDVVDTRMRTPLYCLVKRPGVAAIRQKCRAIGNLIERGCDDLGLAINPKTYFTEELIKNIETNISNILQNSTYESTEPIFTRTTHQRVPSLKHLSRLKLIKLESEKNGDTSRQMSFTLPNEIPKSLNTYINRRVLHQTELF